MNRLIPFLFVLIACSSCSVYQYNVFSSNDKGSEDEPFTFENDTLRLSYSFDNGFENIQIYNKLDKPLYVDWAKSALIVNGVSTPYFDGKSSVDLVTSTYRTRPYGNSGYTTGYTSGTIDNKASITFIPPDSKFDNAPVRIANMLPIKYDGNKFKQKVYTEETTPVKFRSYLSISLTDDFSNPITYDHTFWLSEIYQYKTKPVVTPKQNAYLTDNIDKTGGMLAGTFIGVGLMVVLVTQIQAQQSVSAH